MKPSTLLSALALLAGFAAAQSDSYVNYRDATCEVIDNHAARRPCPHKSNRQCPPEGRYKKGTFHNFVCYEEGDIVTSTGMGGNRIWYMNDQGQYVHTSHLGGCSYDPPPCTYYFL